MAETRTISYEARSKRTWRDDLQSNWNRFAGRFTRENIVSNLKTLAWVVPLTLLIWIYAEREQVATTKDISVPFDAISIDPNVAIKVLSPPDQNLILELQGPQARLQDVLGKLRGGMLPQGLKIEVPTSLEKNRVHPLMSLDLVRNQKIFIDNGVTVLGCQPARLDVMLDAVVDREAKIVRPPELKNVEVTFTPPTLKLRGPLSVFENAKKNTGEVVLLAELNEIASKGPSHFDKDISLRRPAELADDRVTFNGPSTVHATGDVRQADETLLIRSMVITVDATDGLLDKYKVVWEKPSQPALLNVTVTGPADLIKQLDKLDVKPKARLVLTPQDVGGRRSKAVKYDLPDGVSVTDDDKNRTVDFQLVEKSTLPAGP